jgi:hypothetical protein
MRGFLIFPRRCEKRSDEAIQLSLLRKPDCFAALATTVREW